MRAVTCALIIVVVAAAMAMPAARSEDMPIQAFYGKYEGRTLFPMGEPRNRELSVLIRAEGRFGFAVEWQTTIHKAHKKPVRRDQRLIFQPTTRTNVYIASPPTSANTPAANASPAENPAAETTAADNAMSRVYGPLDGTAYAWARILGSTLTVNVFTIDEEGDYVVQSYNRTLTDKGLRLEFTRVRDGQIEQQIKGDLARVGG